MDYLCSNFLREWLVNNRLNEPQSQHLSAPGATRRDLEKTLIMYINVLHHPIEWMAGKRAIPEQFRNLGDNIHRVKLVTYCGLIDSRLAPDVKEEGVHQSQ